VIRYGLWGGARPPVPWEFFVTIGGAALAAGTAFVVIFPLWNSYPVLGYAETAVYAVAGSALVVAGLVRRSRTKT
jgi:hypothetical protein